MTQIITQLSEVSHNYDALFVDLWGCVHNGVKAFPEAVAALQEYRRGGGVVILVTNSPQPWKIVQSILPRFGVPEDCWDAIATSGDSARVSMFRGAIGQKVYFMGDWARDEGFFEPLDVLENPLEITRVSLEEAEGVVCCGPLDPFEDPSENRGKFLYAKQKGIKLLCANPDIIVDRGESREWCAGALAQLYTEMGGESLYFGKPHPPIYDLARLRLSALDRKIADDRILAIGDGIQTDISGAMGEDIDSLFISGGLAAAETKTSQHPDPDALTSYLIKENQSPTFTIGKLR